MINIVCVLKESNLYSKEWVYKLQRSVDKHLQIPHRFVCLSNVPLDCEYRLLDEDVEGWWNKIQLFKPNFFTEETIYFDLDVVISKPLDELINNLRSQNKNFMMAKEPPDISNSSVMYWRGDYSMLYHLYNSNANHYHKIYKKVPLIGDQAFISQEVKHGFINDVLPSKYITWCKNPSINVSDETGLLIFLSKKFKPHMFVDHEYIKENWK